MNKTSLSIAKGKTYALKSSVAPKTANNRAVSWKSSNTKVAKVTSAGKVIAVGKGTATITCAAKDGSGQKAYCKIKVTVPSTKRRSYSGGGNSGRGSNSGGTVWISATGSKYHNKNNCGTMKPSKARLRTLMQSSQSKFFRGC